MRNQSLIIEVKKEKGGKHHLSKPKEPEGQWTKHYTVKEKGKGFSVHVHWNEKGPGCPVLLYFSADEVITGVGFSECKDGIDQYTSRGPCGGCFFLCGDLPASGAEQKRVAVVENWGNTRKKGYHFEIWLNGSPTGFDPQIYNEGQVHPLPDEERWKRKLLRLLRRLTPWLR